MSIYCARWNNIRLNYAGGLRYEFSVTNLEKYQYYKTCENTMLWIISKKKFWTKKTSKMCALTWLGNSLVAAHRCLPIVHIGTTSDRIMQVACVVNSLLQICGNITKLVKLKCCGYSARKRFERIKTSKICVLTWLGNS